MRPDVFSAALAYAGRGYSVIPVRGDKKPYIPWGEYRKRRATADEIRAWAAKYPDAMIGIVTGGISGILAVDCDTAAGYEAVQNLLPDHLNLPVARTPRGGWHLWFRYPLDSGPTVGAGVMPGVDFRGEGGYIIVPPSVNAEGGAYRWQEGLALDDVEPPRMPSALLSALSINNKNTYNRGVVDTAPASPDMFAHGRRDNDLFHTANCLVKGGMPAAEIRQVLEYLIVSWGEHPDRQWIDAKVESALKRAEKREIHFAQEVREFVMTSNGFFLTSDVINRLQVTSRQDRKNIAVALLRLYKEGLIERQGERDGCYRRIDNDLEPLDWLHADVTPLDLSWPLGIENLVSLYPGNLGVIAGSPNAGKTSFILNFIKMNQHNHDIHLFSSEGGKEELKMRLTKFGCPLSDWRFRAWDRSDGFADVVRPDAVNVIDYLEIHDDFFKVGGKLKAIADRLQGGFALIALQKNSGRDEGLGGTRSLEKPRLYMAMEHGQLKIVKAKTWKKGDCNPNGMVRYFKIVDGCTFYTTGDWENG